MRAQVEDAPRRARLTERFRAIHQSLRQGGADKADKQDVASGKGLTVQGMPFFWQPPLFFLVEAPIINLFEYYYRPRHPDSDMTFRTDLGASRSDAHRTSLPSA